MTEEKKQIFIVDDDPSVCRALSVLLSSCGFTVDVFTSAANFFRAVSNATRGCLILDVHMPGFNGWKTLQQLRVTGSRRPVIIISGDLNEEFSGMALKAGAAGYLQKPFNDQALFDLIG